MKGFFPVIIVPRIEDPDHGVIPDDEIDLCVRWVDIPQGLYLFHKQPSIGDPQRDMGIIPEERQEHEESVLQGGAGEILVLGLLIQDQKEFVKLDDLCRLPGQRLMADGRGVEGGG